MSNPLRQPAEWALHDWVWIGFPHDADEWPGMLDAARSDVADFANAVQAHGEQVRLVVRDAANAAIASRMVSMHVEIVEHPLGDIWLRDTGPLIVSDGKGQQVRRFGFNGWGGKYEMEGDREIGDRLALDTGLPCVAKDWILEGGAIDVDGSGLAVTTEQCLLNPNRNPHLDRSAIESRLSSDLGIETVLWLGQGLTNDHTDGHVDNLARFVGKNRLAIPQAANPDDPNAAVFADAWDRAQAMGVEVVSLPSPGLVERHGQIVPASYMNFYISNGAVIVPLYNVPNDMAAVRALASLFPDRKVVGLAASGILSGGGSFHCASQQMPAAPIVQ